MYYIKKYANCWAIHNDANSNSRKLTPKEVKAVQNELPELKSSKVAAVYSDSIRSIKEKP